MVGGETGSDCHVCDFDLPNKREGIDATMALANWSARNQPSKNLAPSSHSRKVTLTIRSHSWVASEGRPHSARKCRLRPKGVGEEGVGEKLGRVFSGFFPWQVREWYVPGPSRHHQIPNFLRTLHLFQQVFSGF